MFLKAIVIFTLFAFVINEMKMDSKKHKEKQDIQIENFKNLFSFSSLSKNAKYKFYSIAKLEEMREKLKKKKENARLKLSEKLNKLNIEKVYKELLKQGHVSILRDFYSPVFKK